jgi:hypothetical protein
MPACRMIVGLFSTLALAVCAWATDISEFKSFASTEGGFTVSFPGQPEQSTSTFKAPLGNVELHVFRAARNKDKELYTLTYNDIPNAQINGDGPEKVLDAARDGGIEATHGKLIKETKVALANANSSRDLEIEIQGATTYSRMILAGNRLYVIMSYPDGSKGSTDRAKAFLDSFKLTREDAASEK